jgi:hypothetical protein
VSTSAIQPGPGPGPGPDAAYDPVHDLAIVLGSAMRVGAHGPAARSALDRLTSHLDVHEGSFVSAIEDAIRGSLRPVAGGQQDPPGYPTLEASAP